MLCYLMVGVILHLYQYLSFVSVKFFVIKFDSRSLVTITLVFMPYVSTILHTMLFDGKSFITPTFVFQIAIASFDGGSHLTLISVLTLYTCAII